MSDCGLENQSCCWSSLRRVFNHYNRDRWMAAYRRWHLSLYRINLAKEGFSRAIRPLATKAAMDTYWIHWTHWVSLPDTLV